MNHEAVMVEDAELKVIQRVVALMTLYASLVDRFDTFLLAKYYEDETGSSSDT